MHTHRHDAHTHTRRTEVVMARASQIANKSQSGKSGKKGKPPHAEIKKRSSSKHQKHQKHRSREKEAKARRREESKSAPSSSKKSSKSTKKTSKKSTKGPKKTIKKPKKTKDQIQASRARRSSALKRANAAKKNAASVSDGRAVIKESTIRRIIRGGTQPLLPTGNETRDMKNMLSENAENIDIGLFENCVMAASASYSKDALQVIAANTKELITEVLKEAAEKAVANDRTTIYASDMCNNTMSKISAMTGTNVMLPKGLVNACVGIDARGKTEEEVLDHGGKFVPMIGFSDEENVDKAMYGDVYERAGVLV